MNAVRHSRHMPRKTPDVVASSMLPGRSGVALCLVLIVCVGLWWLWPRTTVLSEREYDVALALVRVCNQKNTAALSKIESLLAQPQESGPSAKSSALTKIVDLAKGGDWDSAEQACRRVLDEQVNRIR